MNWTCRGEAWIEGAPADFGEAVDAAAGRLAKSRQTLVTGLRTDVEGVRAALALARAVGGAVDHDGSAALARTLEAARGPGLFRGVPAELRRRCDRWLVVGADAGDVAPGLLAHLLSGPVDLGRGAGARRSVVWLGAPPGGRLPGADADVEALACPAEAICGIVGILRASLAGRRFDASVEGAARAVDLAAWLAAATFAGVAWSSRASDGVATEMLAGLVADLNGPTRASAVPLLAPDGAAGAVEVAGWTTGFALPVGFAGEVDHDPWRFDGARLLASGECDLVVEVSALDGAPPCEPPADAIPRIALSGAPPPAGAPPAVAFRIAVAGRDHPGALWDERIASFAAFEPAEASEAPSAGVVLRAIAEAYRRFEDREEAGRC